MNEFVNFYPKLSGLIKLLFISTAKFFNRFRSLLKLCFKEGKISQRNSFSAVLGHDGYPVFISAQNNISMQIDLKFEACLPNYARPDELN
jgi:hypothetical protein